MNTTDDNVNPDENQTSLLCESGYPTFHEYASVTEIVLISVFGFLTLLMVMNYVEELVYIYQNVHNGKFKPHDKARWLLAVYPIMSLTAFVALIVPRSSGLNDLVASIFIAVCVYIFVAMLIEHHGGASKMMATLQDSRLRLNVPPLCCCCACCPKPKMNGVRIQVLYSMVLQFALIRPFIGYVIAVMWADTMGDENGSVSSRLQSYLGYVYLLSTLMAMWSFAVVFQLSKTPLEHLFIRPKFICLQLVLIISGLQRPIIEAFVMSDYLGCTKDLGASAIADRWNHMLIIVEMAVISCVARIYYRHLRYREPTNTSTLLNEVHCTNAVS